MKKIQAILGTVTSAGVITIIGDLDRNYPLLEGFQILFPDGTNVTNPILNKIRIGDVPYLPDGFPALAIGVKGEHSISPNERFFSLLDTINAEGKKFEVQIQDAGYTVDYDVCFLFFLTDGDIDDVGKKSNKEKTDESKSNSRGL